MWRKNPPKEHPGPQSDYVPKYLKEMMRNFIIQNDKRSFYEFRKAIRNKERFRIPSLVFGLHTCCEQMNLRAAEKILMNVDAEIRNKIVNSVRGRHQYTPLCRSSWHGDEQMVRYLVSLGADITFTNSHGECLEDILELGQQSQIEKNEENKIFIQDRYQSCLDYIQKYKDFVMKKKARQQDSRKCSPSNKE